MKLILLLTITLGIKINASVYSQTTLLSLDVKNVSIREVLSQLEGSSKFKFFYNEDFINVDKLVSLKVSDNRVNEILEKMLRETEIDYRILENNMIVLTKKNALQGIIIKGKVTDTEGNPLPGVNVVEKGTTIGTVTNLDGEYTIKISAESSVLSFSFVGFLTENIDVNGQNVIDVTLIEDITALEEIVVIGYGTLRKEDVTSSITSVKSDNFIQGAVVNPLQLVQGKVAGLNITRESDDPNSSVSVLLRGVTSINASMSPLIVIDGIPGGSLSSVAKSDIESIDVLKDGSAAAIYGTRGTNGVIIITTKTGKTNSNVVEYESYVSYEAVAKKLDVFTAEEYRALEQLAATDHGYSTDWVDEMLDKTPFSHYHDLSLLGGSEQTSYRLSFNYRNIDPIAKTNYRSEYGVRANIKHTALDEHLSIVSNLSKQMIKGNTVSTGAFEEAIIQNPTMPVYAPEDPLEFFRPGGNTFNPVAYLKENPSEFDRGIFMGNLKATLTILKGLDLSATYSAHSISKTSNSYSYIDSHTSTSNGYDGKASKEESHSADQIFESMIDYTLQNINKHRLSSVAGYSYQKTIQEGFSATNYDFLSDGFLWNNLSEGSYLAEGRADMDSEKSESKLVAFFARMNYSFDDKYLLSASVRREGSTKFGANNKWGTFPAVSIGWRVSRENFMLDFNWLNDLKFRAGYGVTGNQGFDSYQSIETYSTTSYVYDVDAGGYVQGYGPTINPNPDLRWEKKHEYNIGIDFSLFGGRLGGTIDGYTRLTKDLLYEVNAAQPPNLYETMLENIGELKNTGIEITLEGNPVVQNDLTWNTSVTWAKFTNEVLKLTSSDNDVEYLDLYGLPAPGNLGSAFRLEEGGQVSQFYGYRYAGLNENGEWLLYTQNGEKVTKDEISTDDKTYIGNGLPLMNLGWNNTFTYKQWDLTFFFRGNFDFDILNMKDMYYGNITMLPDNLLSSSVDKHKDLNDAPLYSDYYLEKGDYIKLDNLTLGYNFDCSDVKYLNRLRLYFTARNVFVITKYTGLDPEIYSSAPLTSGADTRTFYPRTRTISFGINCSF